MRAFRIAYDGRPFSGFQRQPQVPTVEDTLFDALRKHGMLDADAEKPPGYTAAGRTDAGVSAVGQTVAFEAPGWLTPRAFNGQLPGCVRVWAAADVPADFHATHDALRRTYRYYLYAPRIPGTNSVGTGADSEAYEGDSHLTPSVDDDRVRDALDVLAGRHDFSNFTPDDRLTRRHLSTGLWRDGDTLVVEVAAGGFPRSFVRRVVTLVRAVGTGDATCEDVTHALGPDPLPGGRAFGAAPPEPLVLWDVAYDATVEFTTDRDAAETGREAFAERHVTAQHAAAVTRALHNGLDGDGTDSVR